MNKKHKNIIIFGSPGSGKTTQIDMLEDAVIDFSLISVGQMLRSEVISGSDLGERIRSDMEKGNLVDDHLVTELVKKELSKIDRNKMIILDGYPRSLNQVNVVDDLFEKNDLDLPVMIFIKISEEEAIKRLSSRRVCSKCKENFSINDLEDKKKCLKCGGELIHRSDDKESAIKTRLEIFDMQMEIVKHYFQKRDRFFEVSGEGDKEEIHNKIVRIIKEKDDANI